MSINVNFIKVCEFLTFHQSADHYLTLFRMNLVQLSSKIEEARASVKEFEAGIDTLRALHNNVFSSVRQDAGL